MLNASLDLLTTQTRPTVRLDGADVYEVRTSNDLTLAQFRAVERIAPVLGLQLQRRELPEDAEVEVRGLLRELCAIALIAPADVVGRLSDVALLQVTDLFIDPLMPSLLALRAMAAGATRSGGTAPSPDSSGSTEAISTAGVPRSPSA